MQNQLINQSINEWFRQRDFLGVVYRIEGGEEFDLVDPVRAHHPLGRVGFALFHQKSPRDTGIVGMWQAQATPKPIIMEAPEANHSDFSGLVAHQQDALRFLEVIV